MTSKQKAKWIKRAFLNWGLLIVLLVGLLGAQSDFINRVVAQSEDTWTTPINLSKSGSTSDPNLVVDSDGIIHAIWVDQFAGSMYAQLGGGEWSQPVPVSFPFSTNVPLLFADGEGYVHAFWTETTNILFHSRVQAQRFGDSTAWGAPQALAESALAMDAAIDAQNNIHLSYIRALDTQAFPAGVYYRQSSDSGSNWTSGVFLYRSPYFRALSPGEAHVQIATTLVGDDSQVYVAWDDRPRGRIFLAKSVDDGENWSDPIEIDRPDSNFGTVTSFNIRLRVKDDNVIVIWQNGDPATNCTQFFKSSNDGGSTWSEASQMLANVTGCSDNTFLQTGDETTLLQVMLPFQIYLMAWDGSQWSYPRIQQELSSFFNPDTSTRVDFGCQKSAITSDNHLVVIACDTGRGGDIWFTSRTVGDMLDWFPSPNEWSPISEVVANQTRISNLQLISDNSNEMHLLWSQSDGVTIIGSRVAPDTTKTSIYYANWDGVSWSVPVSVLKSPDGSVIESAVQINSADHLMVAWSSNTGQLYFSWVNSSRANVAQEWAAPVTIPAIQDVNSSPEILVLGEDVVYIIFAVPINEERGIYLTQSLDRGTTWSQPVQVFDGAAAGWQMVDLPHLAMDGDGNLHAIWSQFTSVRESIPLGVYYARSLGDWTTWTEPEIVSEAKIIWSSLISSGQSTLYRSWEQVKDGIPVVNYQISQDGGLNWSLPAEIPGFDEILGLSSLVVDAAGQLHLLQSVQDYSNNFGLRYRIWDGARWLASERWELNSQAIFGITAVTADISPSGILGVVYATNQFNEDNNLLLQEGLNFSSRTVEIPNVLPTLAVLPSGSITPAASTPIPADSEGEATAQPTPTIALADLPIADSGPLPGNLVGIVILSAMVAGGVLVFIVLIKANPLKNKFRQAPKNPKSRT